MDDSFECSSGFRQRCVKIQEPYYNINEETKNIINELINTCKKLKLGNVSFHYFQTEINPGAQFVLTENKFYWELTVRSEHQDKHFVYWSVRDIYKLSEAEISYLYSEKDLS